MAHQQPNEKVLRSRVSQCAKIQAPCEELIQEDLHGAHRPSGESADPLDPKLRPSGQADPRKRGSEETLHESLASWPTVSEKQTGTIAQLGGHHRPLRTTKEYGAWWVSPQMTSPPGNSNTQARPAALDENVGAEPSAGDLPFRQKRKLRASLPFPGKTGQIPDSPCGTENQPPGLKNVGRDTAQSGWACHQSPWNPPACKVQHQTFQKDDRYHCNQAGRLLVLRLLVTRLPP